MLILLSIPVVYFLIGWVSFTLQMREINRDIEMAAKGEFSEEDAAAFNRVKPRLYSALLHMEHPIVRVALMLIWPRYAVQTVAILLDYLLRLL